MGRAWIFVFLASCFLMMESKSDAVEMKTTAKILGMKAPIIVKQFSLRKDGRHVVEGGVRLPDFDQNIDKFMKKKGDLLPKEWQVDAYWLGETMTQVQNQRLYGRTKMHLNILRLFQNRSFVYYSLALPVFRSRGEGESKFFLRLKIRDIKGIPRFIERLAGVGKTRDVAGFAIPDFEHDAGRFKWCALTDPRYRFSYRKDGKDLLMNFKINTKLIDKQCNKNSRKK